ncbi:MAG: hypothetical protein HQ581_09500 [Planctomycetes bacterium]|nr:hypothetical protein [Planctomycetota bacterium]
MKERPIHFPIPFSAAMIPGVLDGTKTQTRRVVRFPKWGNRQTTEADWDVTDTGNGELHLTVRDGIVLDTPCGRSSKAMRDQILRCPYGGPGDRLWVRECWRLSGGPQSSRVIYRADGETAKSFCGVAGNGSHKELEPVFGWEAIKRYGTHCRIHMPRWASRITLELTDVRIVQEISEADANPWVRALTFRRVEP